MTITLTEAGEVRWPGGPEFTSVVDKQPGSTSARYAVRDMKAFVKGAKEISERCMQWKSGSAYREAVRFGDRVLIVWGRNNARDLQSFGVVTTEASAKALMQAFRSKPLKGFVESSPYFLEGRGAVVREYWPVPEKGKHGKVERGRGSTVDNVVEWVTQYPRYKYETRTESLPSEKAAHRRFDALELDWYRRGGRPYEIEWMKERQRRASYSVYEWFLRHREAGDPVKIASKLLRDAKIDAGKLPTDVREIIDAIGAVPAAHWVRVGEVVGKLTRVALPKAEVILDATLLVVATVKRDRTGKVKAVRVQRAASLAAAKLLFDAQRKK